MKKTIVTLLALGSVSMGATIADIDTSEATLKAYWNFDSSNALTAGSTEITWNELPTWNAAGYGVSTATDKHPYTTGAGLKSTTGFTVSFDINDARNGTLLSMTTGDMTKTWRSLSITLSDNVVSAQFLGNTQGAVSATLTATQLADEWTTLTLVGSTPTGTNTVVLDFYVNGDHIGTSSTANATNFVAETINKMQFGYYGASANSAPTNIDNILIYNKALTADEVKALIVPEPTTATLSLLALAGLAARRRRK